MNCKPPISQKLSPITIKSHIKATKPKYYSPKTKPTESFTPNTNNFTTYVTPYLSPSKITSLHEKQLKKSGSNEYFNPNTVKPSYFDFKQQKILDINDKNEIDQAFITTLRSLRKEIKPYKSEGELKAYNLNKPIEKDLIKGSIYHKNLIRDDINGPTFLGLEPKPNKPFSGFQSSVLDRCLPKFSHNMNIKMKPRIDYSNNLIKKNDYNEKFEYSIKKPEYVESFVNVISNDSDLKVKPIKNIEFSANPFNQSILFKNNNNFNKKNNWRIEDFDLGKCLGKGKFGKVFIAREKKTRCLFAIKCILKKGLGGGNLEQMVREIKIHSFLQHVNVVQFFGCFEDGVKVYLILELALQGNLFTELRKQVFLCFFSYN